MFAAKSWRAPIATQSLCVITARYFVRLLDLLCVGVLLPQRTGTKCGRTNRKRAASLTSNSKRQEALEYYLPANRLEPDNVGSSRPHRAAISPLDDRHDLENGKASARKYFPQYAQRAAALAPNNAEAQLSPAISYGKMLPYMTSKDQVAASPLNQSSCGSHASARPAERHGLAHPRAMESRPGERQRRETSVGQGTSTGTCR